MPQIIRIGACFMVRAAWVASWCLLAVPAWAVNTMWAKDAPIAQLSGDDLKIALATMNKALDDGRDGEVRSWSNGATKASGTVTPGAPFERQGMRCRSARLTIDANGHASSSDWNLCRTPDGWKFAEGR
jgi:surface antigen